MKKIVFCLLVLLALFSTSAVSQEVSVSMPLSSAITKTMVREHPSWGYISYVQTATEHLFVLTYPSMVNNYVVQIPLNIFVNDIEIYRDKVFFCGYNSGYTPSRGLIGYFSIDSLCFINNIYIYDLIQFLQGQTLREFTELEVFDEYQGTQLAGDSVFVALVGLRNVNRYAVVEAIGAYNSPSSWRYVSGHNPTSTIYERFEQISVTDNYIVSGGTVFNRVSGVSFRVFDRHGAYDMFAAGNLHDNVHWYPSNNAQTANSTEYPLQTFEMTAMPNDRVATLSLYKKYTSGVQPQTYGGFLLNVYDIPQTISQNNVSCLYSIFDAPTHSIPTTGTARVMDLRYDIASGNFYALLHAVISNSTTNFDEYVCAIVPYLQTVPSLFKYYYLATTPLDRVVLCNSGSHCLFSGRLTGLNTFKYYRCPTAPTAKCNTQGWRQCTAPEEFLSKTHYYPFTIYRNTFNYQIVNATCVSKSLTVTCQ